MKFPHACFSVFGIDTAKSYYNYQQQEQLLNRVSAEINANSFKNVVMQSTILEKEIFVLLLNYESFDAPLIMQRLKEIAAGINADMRWILCPSFI